MELKDLKNKILSLNEAISFINQNREHWREITRPMLIETLTNVVNQYKINWSVLTQDWTDNHEAVRLSFKPSRSGLIGDFDKKMISHVKEGGSLLFQQTYNGEVFVLIEYPYIEQFVSKMNPKKLGRHKPDEITENFVFERIGEFIEEMAKWEMADFE